MSSTAPSNRRTVSSDVSRRTVSDRQETRVLRCEGTADFIAALPQIAGFTASDSLFLVLFSGKRAGTAARFDLPETEEAADTQPLLDLVCTVLQGTGAQTSPPAVVITSDRTFQEAGGAPWRTLARRLERRLGCEGVKLRELCCIALDGWASYLDPDAPSSGRPLSDIEQSPIALDAAARGETLPDLAALGDIPVAPAARIAEVSAALAALPPLELPGPGAAPPSTLGSGCAADLGWVAESACLVDELIRRPPYAAPGRGPGPGPVGADLAARLTRSAGHPVHWLLLALSALTRAAFVEELVRETGPERFADVPVDAETGWSMRWLLASLTAEAPDRERMRAATEAVRHIVGAVPEERRPPLLALLAWMRWMRGLQSVGGRHIAVALRLDPTNPIVLMVARLIEVPVAPPGWLSP